MEAEMIDSKTESGRVNKLDRSSKTMLLVTTAMMTAMVMIATTFFKLPNAMGYIHLGDGFVLLSAIVLPRKCACFAGGVGAALADIYGGYGNWVAPIADMPGNVLQAVVGAVIAIAVSTALSRTSWGKHFFYRRSMQ